MNHASPLPRNSAWRAAALRGLARIDGRDEALVALGGEQYVRIPLASGRADAFRERIGRCVWVDLDGWAVRLDGPPAAHA